MVIYSIFLWYYFEPPIKMNKVKWCPFQGTAPVTSCCSPKCTSFVSSFFLFFFFSESAHCCESLTKTSLFFELVKTGEIGCFHNQISCLIRIRVRFHLLPLPLQVCFHNVQFGFEPQNIYIIIKSIIWRCLLQ